MLIILDERYKEGKNGFGWELKKEKMKFGFCTWTLAAISLSASALTPTLVSSAVKAAPSPLSLPSSWRAPPEFERTFSPLSCLEIFSFSFDASFNGHPLGSPTKFFSCRRSCRQSCLSMNNSTEQWVDWQFSVKMKFFSRSRDNFSRILYCVNTVDLAPLIMSRYFSPRHCIASDPRSLARLRAMRYTAHNRYMI